MRALAVLIAAACVLWGIDNYEFHSRYSSTLWRAAQNKATLLNYDVKRWVNLK